MKAPKTIVIAGASGVIGSAATEHFAAAGDWSVVALSRRTVNIPNVTSLAVDLLDREQSTAAMTSLRDVTHAVYAALFEKEGLIAGWTDPDQMRTNLRAAVQKPTTVAAG